VRFCFLYDIILTAVILRTIQRDITKKYAGLQVKFLLFLTDVKLNQNYFDRFKKKILKYKIPFISVQWEPSCSMRPDRQTDGRTDGRTDRDRQTDGQTDRQTDRKTDRQTERQTDGRRGGRAGRQIDSQADRQTGRHDESSRHHSQFSKRT